jgi:hypothetical protein
METEGSLEEQADELLRDDAKKRKTTLYREGIIDERRRRLIDRREIPLSKWDKKG